MSFLYVKNLLKVKDFNPKKTRKPTRFLFGFYCLLEPKNNGKRTM